MNFDKALREPLDLRDQLACRMARQVGNEAHGAAIRLYHLRLWQAAGIGRAILGTRVVAALYINSGLQQFDQRTRRWFAEDCYIVNIRKRGQNFGPLVLGYQRTTSSLEQARALIAVQAQHQEITERPRLLQVAHVAQVDQIEAAIGKDAALTRLLPRARYVREFVTPQYLLGSEQILHASTPASSPGVLLAQPSRLTTRAAAAFARYAASAMLAPAVSARVNVAATVSPAPLVSTISLASGR